MAGTETDPFFQSQLQTFREALADLGWVEGRDLHIDVRWPRSDIALQQSHARELVALRPDAILAVTTTTAQALRMATRTISIVFVTLSDPVITGVVFNLARPEGNITGFTPYEYSMAGKWLNLLKDMVPRVARVAMLSLDTSPFAQFYLQAARIAGEGLELTVTAASVHDVSAIEPAIVTIAGYGDAGLFVVPDGGFNNLHKATTIALAIKNRVPAIFYDRSYAAEGGLMSYGPNQGLQYRHGATYVDRILRGAKPGDLPVQFETEFELVINIQAAKALDLEIPPQLLARADEVLE